MSSSYRSPFGRRKFMAGVGGAAAATGLFLAGCGDDDDDEGGSEPTATGTGTAAGSATASATGTAATGQPVQGGGIVFADGADPGSFDPVLAGYIAQFMLSGTHNRLLSWRHGSDTFQLDYAATSDDGLSTGHEQPDDNTIIFTLREGVKFHNRAPVNGAAFTARDVVSTFDRIREGGREFVLTPVLESVTAIDDTHVQFKTKVPYAPFLGLIGHTAFGITSELQTEFGLADQDVGTGPFIFQTHQEGVQSVLERNPDYWNAPRPYLDTVTYRIIPDVNTIYAATRAGDIDWPMHFWNGIPQSIAEEILSSNKDLVGRPWQLTSPRFVTGRMDREPFNDVRVRRAISYAIDRQQWIDLVHEGNGRPTGGMPYMLTDPWYLESDALGASGKYLEHNLTEAKALMEAAGLGDGFETEIKPYTALSAKLPEMDLLVAQLSKINIKLNPVYLTGTEFLQTVSREKNYDGMLFWTHGFTSDFDPLMYNTMVTSNVMMIQDPKVKEYMDKQRGALDQEERIAIIHEFQQYQADNCFNLYEPIAEQQMVSPKDVQNWGPHNSFDTAGVASYVWRSA